MQNKYITSVTNLQFFVQSSNPLKKFANVNEIININWDYDNLISGKNHNKQRIYKHGGRLDLVTGDFHLAGVSQGF